MTITAEQQSLQTSLSVVIERCRSLDHRSLSRRAETTARHSVLDWFGCAVSGASQLEAQRFLGALAPAEGQTGIVGTHRRLHWRDAVVVNGVNGHVLDFDDMLPAFSGHPSAAILPAVLAVAEHHDLGVNDLVTALIAGTELGVWVALQVLPGHYDAGWHATGTIGAFAAAAATAHLLDYSHEQWVTALDVAATQSAGLKAMFGTPAKPMHAGNAAQSGVMAARLATTMTSSGKALAGPSGFIANYSGAGSRSAAQVEDTWAIEGMLYKTYASCFMTQASVDAGRQFAAETGELGVETAPRITITASPKLADVCAIADPQTPTDTKFSLQATFALAASGHDMSREESFSTGNLHSEAYRDLLSRTRLIFDPDLSGSETCVVVHAELPAGGTWATRIDRGTPAADLSEREEQLHSKFTQLTAPHLGAPATRALAETILRGDGSVPELIVAASTLARRAPERT
ncbi:MmgE/PrpD family protein [Corynebacterium maris DSM 45190]|uniref:MmgE/PrpD family protein n=1 Tax=Corynebacterium maris DSM 45190 TaxID=1224163 RepID=S5SVW6_9CORY|nr:MmgE/PrpD family protein [Corynebacterium maris]AGS35364.1 MmgE/PrpD family protein [Corynebacterium maris DSM 45190]